MRAFPLLLTCVAAGCSTSLEPAPEVEADRGVAQFTLGSVGAQSDTIGAQVAPLEFTVEDTVGAPYAGEPILVQASVVDSHPIAAFRSNGTELWRSVLIATTDNLGRVSLDVQLGDLARSDNVRLSGVRIGGATYVQYTVLPGQPTRVDLILADTIAIVGDTVRVSARTWDREENVTAASPALTVTGPAEVIGNNIVGTEAGPVTVIGTAGAFGDTLGIGFLPAGRLAFNDFGNVSASRLDGSNLVTLDLGSGASIDAAPAGTTAVLAQGRLRLFNLPGTSTRVTGPDADAAFSQEESPRFSGDGQWIYFAAVAGGNGGRSIWRVRPSGADLEQITPFPGTQLADRFPSTSAIGDRIAYVEDRTADQEVTGPLVIRVVSSGQVAPLGVSGSTSRWSPDDAWIAYLDPEGHIRVIRADGMDDREVVSIPVTFDQGFDWSPDGRFLVAVSTERDPYLVEVATGRLTALSLGFSVREAAWYR